MPAAQVQTLPDANPPIGKIHLFSKIALTFKTVMKLGWALRFRTSYKKCNIVYFMTDSTVFHYEGVVALFMNHHLVMLLTKLINHKA